MLHHASAVLVPRHISFEDEGLAVLIGDHTPGLFGPLGHAIDERDACAFTSEQDRRGPTIAYSWPA